LTKEHSEGFEPPNEKDEFQVGEADAQGRQPLEGVDVVLEGEAAGGQSDDGQFQDVLQFADVLKKGLGVLPIF
jgi:hypothetical protein